VQSSLSGREEDSAVPDSDGLGYRGVTACHAVSISYRQLDYWARTGLVVPSVRDASGSGTQRLYSFRDMVVLKVVKRLLDAGVSLQNIRKAIEALRSRGTDDLAALPVPGVNTAPTPVEWPVTDRLADDGVLVWHIPLPGAIRDELDLVRRGDELVVTVGQFRRIVPLPSALRRCAVAGAALREGELRVRFTPDPGLWPREK